MYYAMNITTAHAPGVALASVLTSNTIRMDAESGMRSFDTSVNILLSSAWKPTVVRGITLEPFLDQQSTDIVDDAAVNAVEFQLTHHRIHALNPHCVNVPVKHNPLSHLVGAIP